MSQSGSERDSRPQKLIEKIKQKIENNEKFFSLEFYPPKTFNGATNLMAIIGRINENCTPLFCDITWKPSQDPMSDTCQEPSTLLISAAAVDLYGQNVMIHIPSGSTTKSQVLEHLTRAKELGIGSVLAVKGDAVRDDSSAEREDGFDYTVDLVRFIRSEFGDHFTVGVAGYLMGSSDITSYEEDLKHLKAEVEAGADLIITQMFFEVKTFHKFVEDCHNCGINVPMIPAIFPIQSFHSLRQLKRSSRVEIPQHLFDALAPMKDDSAAVMNFGIKYAAQMCKELFEGGHVHGLHFYTLNREIFLTEVLQKIGMYLEEDDSNIPNLPWMQGPAQVRRAQEELVRPIFWASRPRSYMIRTTNWEEFPNGRWGDSSAASFGQLKDYHLILFGTHKSKEELLNMWGRELDSQSQVFDIFVCYVTGKENKHGFKVKELPWNDEELAPETLQFVDKLSHLNQRGILTINSQPNVNAVPSTDPVVGWGQPGGYVFQKAYLEFFTSEEIAMSLYDVLQEFPMVNYHIVNCSGKDDVTNANVYSSNAVTWGVFPGSEIIQPTVVDPIAFQFWKDEAFALWNHQWGSIYPEKSKSREIIDTIHDTYYLVNLVDNDYVAGNRLFDILDTVLTKLGKI